MPVATIPKAMYEIAASRVKYDPATGAFTWLPRPLTTFNASQWNGQYAGKEAAPTALGRGHRQIRIAVDGKKVCLQAHRLAWFIVHGELPRFEIDHIDQDKENNRISNLRDVPATINMRNLPMLAANKSGVTGVAWSDRERKWKVNIQVNNKVHHLGTHGDFDTAVKVAAEFRAANGFTPHHGQRASP